MEEIKMSSNLSASDLFNEIATQFANPEATLEQIRQETKKTAVFPTPYLAPRTPFEQTVADIVSEVLNLEQVGLNDNFFDLGGNSLLATHLIARFCETFHIEVGLAEIFDAIPTVAGMVDMIQQCQLAQTNDEALAAELASLANLSDEEVQALLADESAS